jgi:hypothetical protein
MQLAHQAVHEAGNVLGEGVVGLEVLVEAVDDEGEQGGLIVGEVED